VTNCRESYAFPEAEINSIKEAAYILSKWLLHPSVRTCALTNTDPSLKQTNGDSGCFTQCQHGEWNTFSPGYTYCTGQEVYQCRTTIFSEPQFDNFVNSTMESYYLNLGSGADIVYETLPLIRIRPDVHHCSNNPLAIGCAITGTVNSDLSFSLPESNGKDESFTIYLRVGSLATPEQFAGVIAHEIMHQMGHKHTKDKEGKDIQTDFTYNFGRCIQHYALNGPAVFE
jgi:hypothetical protein